MKAIVLARYGGPDALELRDVPDPKPGPGEVLVRVRAASLNSADWHTMRADPGLIRLMTGLTRPKQPVFGADISGVVEALGEGVKTLAVGDEVFGEIGLMGRGGFSELAAAPAEKFAKKPASMSFEEAAGLPMAGLTALQAARDWSGGLRPGQRVLVNGAAGGVGHLLVQVAKSMGAHVTAVCRAHGMDAVRKLGADEAIDGDKHDFRRGDQKWDVVFDAAGYQSVRDTARALSDDGTFVFIGGGNAPMWEAMLLGWTTGKKVVSRTAKVDQADLRELAALVDTGKVRVLVDRTFSLAETGAAMAAFEKGGKVGKLVVRTG